MLAASGSLGSTRFATRVPPGSLAARCLRANVVWPRLGCRSNFKRCSTAKPGSQASSQQHGQGQEQQQPPGGGGTGPRPPSPGGSDSNAGQEPPGNSLAQGWTALVGILLAIQPALGTLIAVMGAIAAIVHVLNAPLLVKIDNVESKLDKVESKLDKVESKLDKVESKMTAEHKEIRADINQVLIALVRLEAQLDNSASGRKPGR